MNNRFAFAAVLAGILILMPSYPFALCQDSLSSEALLHAEGEIIQFYYSRPVEKLIRYGFLGDTDDIATIEFGEPFASFMLSMKNFLSMQDNDLHSILRFCYWIVPISFSSNLRTQAIIIPHSDDSLSWGLGGDPSLLLEARTMFAAADGYNLFFIVTDMTFSFVLIENQEEAMAALKSSAEAKYLDYFNNSYANLNLISLDELKARLTLKLGYILEE